MWLEYAAASDVGLVRVQNEDSFVAGPALLGVCDGMGGAQAGEVASESACRALLELTAATDEAEFRRAVEWANTAIWEAGRKESGLSGMGTTLTAVLRSHDEAEFLIAHVGDSRAYLLRRGELSQLTQDHSLVAEMVRQGQLTLEEAAVHPHRSVITRALGTEPEIQIDILRVPIEAGDRLLICSDGMSSMVRRPEEIARLLGEGDRPEEVAGLLIEAALDAGGEDNVTVVVAFVREGDDVGREKPPLFGPEGRTAGRRSRSSHAAGSSAAHPPTQERPRLWGCLGRRRRLLVVVAGVVCALGIGIGVFAAINSSVYFVGVHEGKVSLFKGMPHSVIGIQLYELEEEGKAPYEQLDDYLKQRVDTQGLTTKEEGQQFIRNLNTEG